MTSYWESVNEFEDRFLKLFQVCYYDQKLTSDFKQESAKENLYSIIKCQGENETKN